MDRVPRGAAGGLLRHRLSPRAWLGERHVRPAARIFTRRACGATAFTAWPMSTCSASSKRSPPSWRVGASSSRISATAPRCARSKAGKSVSSTMSFTPLDGLAMGTRCGQLDPGVVLYLLRRARHGARGRYRSVHRGSGLKGMSGVSQDVRDIEAADTTAARHAIDYFVHRARYEIGGLGGGAGRGGRARLFRRHRGARGGDPCAHLRKFRVARPRAGRRSATGKSEREISADAIQGESPIILSADEELTIARADHCSFGRRGCKSA